MTIFDLLFLAAMLALVGAIVATAYQAIRGRGARALAILRRVAMTAAAYFAVIVAVSVATPQRIVSIGAAQCFDDWCITVSSLARSGDTVRVGIELSSTARGISQGERDVRVVVVDAAGRRYLPIPESAATPLSVTIPPQGRVSLGRTFLVEANTANLVLLVEHDWFPHCCIIGGRESLLHRATVVPLR